MKKVLSLILAVFITIPGHTVYSEPVVKKQPHINSRYVLVMDYNSGRVLFEKNSKAIVSMASTTKIMTAIVALENSDLKDIVTVSKKASSIQGSRIGLKPGQELTMEELLYGLMLRSGNDCAIAIAEHVGGSVEKFAIMMNSKAFDIGAFNTRFVTPHGLDTQGHFTTAYDLALITRFAFTHEMFLKIVSSKDISIEGVSGPRTFHNINKLLWSVEGADGVKTGYTGKAGRCLVSSASRYEKRVICVVLNSPNRWEESRKLIEYGFSNYCTEITVHREEYVSYVDVNDGSKSKVRVEINGNYTIPLSEEEKSIIILKRELPDSITAPVYNGQQVGRLIMYSDGKEIYSAPYKAVEDIKESKVNNLFDRFLKKQ